MATPLDRDRALDVQTNETAQRLDALIDQIVASNALWRDGGPDQSGDPDHDASVLVRHLTNALTEAIVLRALLHVRYTA